ncbi:MAG: threonine/serine exporter family protein, partial [Aggregatilineales bacterium]
MTLIELIQLVLEDALWSALAAMGFAILFNVPRRSLLYCMLIAAVGHASRAVMIETFDLSIVASTFVGATVIGFLAKMAARQLQMPSMIFAISAAIPMVPGVFAFQTMLGILRIIELPSDEIVPVLGDIASNGITTGLILAALA